MEWYSKYLQVYEKPFAEAPQAVIEEVRRNLVLVKGGFNLSIEVTD